MDTEPRVCDLCSLPVIPPGFPLNTTSGLKVFCCEGCQGIYAMLHEADILPEAGPARAGSPDLPLSSDDR
ncbi:MULTISPECIES: heavy metal translocating P-type ATPase metal-binding domain-containing protein [unclassified Methylococcus]|uniref:heavy metal translocating P-type ATPase metal-binding domain-containing protein n=1 Tax=unclassified Methylococcus TaxID=2618889 RepID=UPI003D7D0091